MSNNINNSESLNKNNKVPILRFVGFSSPWISYRIDELVEKAKHSFTGGPFGSNLKVEDYTPAGVRVIQLNNINDIYFNDENRIFVSKEKADSLKSCNAYPGDIIVAKMMPAGRACILPYTYLRYLLGSDAIRVKINEHNFDSFFVVESINRPCVRNSITSRTAGSTRQRIGLPELKKTAIYVPSLDEQKHISNFFRLIEEKIKIINSKIDTLKKYIKGLRKTIFTNCDSFEPLRKIAIFEQKSSVSAGSSIENGRYTLYKSGQTNGQTDKYTHDGIYIIANDGGEALFKLTNGKFSYTDHCICFKCKSNEQTIFLYNYLKTLEKKITYIGFTGTGLKNIDRQYFGMIPVPIINHQKDVSALLLIDKDINNLQEKLKTIIKIKKGLLDKLFI